MNDQEFKEIVTRIEDAEKGIETMPKEDILILLKDIKDNLINAYYDGYY